MKTIAQDDLRTLRKKLEELVDFTLGLHHDETPYFLRFIENMKNNLDICLLVQYEGWEQMEYILKRDWTAANHRLIGIPGFDIYAENQEKKKELDCQFLELISIIESYLRSY